MSALEGIVLVRHGETNDNLPPLKFQGFTDTPLNDTGRRQAHDLAQRLAGEPVASLWTSDLSRAQETAQILGARHGLEPRPDARLREGNRGIWETRMFADVEREEPEPYAAWQRGEPDFRFPGGESLQEQMDRVTQSLIEIHAYGELPALVVCHGGSIRVMLCQRDPRGLRAFHTFEVPNTAVIRL
jgi:broad specificity phosphatase PhoE